MNIMQHLKGTVGDRNLNQLLVQCKDLGLSLGLDLGLTLKLNGLGLRLGFAVILTINQNSTPIMLILT